MKKDSQDQPRARKLTLNRETVRNLQSDELAGVAGGLPNTIDITKSAIKSCVRTCGCLSVWPFC